MSSNPEEFARRREELIARAEAQRVEIGYQTQRLCAPLRMAETAFNTVNTVRRSPLLMTGIGLLLLKTPWRRLAIVPKVAWRGWQVLQFARRFLR